MTGRRMIYVAVLLSACGPSLPTPATEQEKRDAASIYLSCLMNAALRLDDGKSDASTIRAAIALLCTKDFDTFAKFEGRGMLPEAQRNFEAAMTRGQVGLATQAVLEVRSGTRCEHKAVGWRRNRPTGPRRGPCRPLNLRAPKFSPSSPRATCPRPAAPTGARAPSLRRDRR